MCICTQHTGGVAPGEEELNNTHARKYKRSSTLKMSNLALSSYIIQNFLPVEFLATKLRLSSLIKTSPCANPRTTLRFPREKSL